MPWGSGFLYQLVERCCAIRTRQSGPQRMTVGAAAYVAHWWSAFRAPMMTNEDSDIAKRWPTRDVAAMCLANASCKRHRTCRGIWRAMGRLFPNAGRDGPTKQQDPACFYAFAYDAWVLAAQGLTAPAR
jgi:hypothetical protein